MKQLTIIHILQRKRSISDDDIHLHSFGDKKTEIFNIFRNSCFYPSIFVSIVDGEIYNICNIEIFPVDKIVYGHRSRNIRKQYWSEQEVQNVANNILSLNGYRGGIPDFIIDEEDLISLKYNIVKEKGRLDDGYVMHKSDHKKHSTMDYVGGFSLETYFSDILISYIEKGLVSGYLSNRHRKVWIDELLEEILLFHMKAEDFAKWLISYKGNDFINKLPYVYDKNMVEQFIEKEAIRIQNKTISNIEKLKKLF